MSELMHYFRIEAAELLEKLQKGGLALEKEHEWQAAVTELQRAAHTLKGAARLVDLFDAGDLAHDLEDSLAKVQATGGQPSREMVSAMLGIIDRIENCILPTLDPNSGNAAALEHQTTLEVTQERIMPPHALPISDRATVLGTLPPLNKAEAHGSSTQDSNTEVFTRVKTETLGEISSCAAELAEFSSRIEDWQGRLAQLSKALDTAGLDSLEYSVLGDLDGALQRVVPRISRMHGLALTTRFLSVESEVHRFEKIVRSTALQLKKDVTFAVSGQHVQVDRVVLQQLLEPFAHILRNAVAHGIELPEERVRIGKSAAGSISMHFERTVDSIRVIVEDDGRGLESDKLRALIQAESLGRPQEPTEIEIHNAIFRSGVSTSSEITEISGRGVGLDIVKDAIAQLRGTVTVESQKDTFCRFVFVLPANLDIFDVFLIKEGAQDFMLPISSVIGTLLVKQEEFVTFAGAPAIMVERTPVPVYVLTDLLGVASKESVALEGWSQVVLVASDSQRFALVTTRLEGRQRIAVKSVGPRLKAHAILAGAAIMNDGRPGFLLNISELARRVTEGAVRHSNAARAQTTVPPSVLVVDDSLTTRMLEKSLLEAAGYDTHLANSGQQALELIQQGRFDLLIVDFEMPGMNGIELIEHARRIPGYQEVPIVMLTSLGNDEDKRKGLAAGVRAYIVKGTFDQTEFLNTVRRLIIARQNQ